MIRTWVKNLCKYIDNLDTSCSTASRHPIIGDKSVTLYSYYDGNGILLFYNNNNTCIAKMKVEHAESVLLEDAISNFNNRVNEARILEILKPFCGPSEEI